MTETKKPLRDNGRAEAPRQMQSQPQLQPANVTACGDQPQILTRWELVTPEKAAEYLLRNTRNRKQSKSLVERYSADLESGFWQITHQGIAFDTSGALVDGQHRLQAIVNSGIGLWMLVTEGLPEGAIEALDRGKNRTLAHTLQIMGHKLDTPRSVGMARAMWMGATMNFSVTDAALRRFMDEHCEALIFAGEQIPHGAAPVTVPAAMARAYYGHSPEKLQRFAAAMRDEIPTDDLQPGDRSARLLGAAVAKSRSEAKGSGAIARLSMYRKAQNALLAFLEGRDLRLSIAWCERSKRGGPR